MTRRIKYYWDLLYVLTQKEVKIRYKNSVLGYLWSIAHPLAFAFVFYVAFKVVMRMPIENYVLFLISGLFPWQWFSNSVNASPTIFIGNASIIKKVNFPRNIIPLTICLHDMLHFVLSIPVILLFTFIYHKTPFFSWLYGIPVLLCIQFLMIYGISLIISSLNLFFRDLERLTVLFMTFLFYFTPVIFSESMIPDKFKHMINFNPLAPLMISWRNLFLDGTLNPEYLALSAAYALLFLALGYGVYRKLSWRFAEVL